MKTRRQHMFVPVGTRGQHFQISSQVRGDGLPDVTGTAIRYEYLVVFGESNSWKRWCFGRRQTMWEGEKENGSVAPLCIKSASQQQEQPAAEAQKKRAQAERYPAAQIRWQLYIGPHDCGLPLAGCHSGGYSSDTQPIAHTSSPLP